MSAARFASPTLFALAVLVESGAARADDLEGLLEQPVVTTVSQTAETKASAPATSSVITAEDLRRHGIRTLNEAINYLGLGMFTSSPAHGGEIGARGVQLTADYGNHLLLLVDGHAVNEPYGGAASFDRGLGVPLELIDHIELVLGPGAVLYGNNAMLGVVHVITKRAADYSGVHVIADSELATWGKIAVGAGTKFELFGRSFELTTQVEHAEQKGPAFTFSPQVYGNDSVTNSPKRFTFNQGTGVWGGTANRTNTSRAPAGYLRLVTGDLDVSLRASSFQRSSPYLDAMVGVTGAFDDPHNYELERWLSVDAKYRMILTRRLELKTRVYADQYTYDWYNHDPAAENCFEGQINGCRRHLGAEARWVGTELRASYDWLGSGAMVTMLGTDARYEHVIADSHTVGQDGVGATADTGRVDVSNLRLGVYAQQTATPFRWLALNAGARIDVAEGYPGALSPRASAAATPWEDATLKAIYSEAFRAPSSYEREYQDVQFLRNPGLGPEHERSAEGSFEQRFGTKRLLVGVFRTEWTDLVTATTVSEAELPALLGSASVSGTRYGQYRNASKIHNWGFNAAVDGVGLERRLRWGLNLTGAQSRVDRPDADPVPLTVTPSLFGNARASYELGGKLPVIALAAQFAGHRFADRSFDAGFSAGLRAPPVLEVRAALTGDVPKVPGLAYRATVNYAFESLGPYVIGPVQNGSLGAAPTLNPVDRFRVGIGLHWTWDFQGQGPN